MCISSSLHLLTFACFVLAYILGFPYLEQIQLYVTNFGNSYVECLTNQRTLAADQSKTCRGWLSKKGASLTYEYYSEV